MSQVAETEAPQTARLNININADTNATLRSAMDQYGISMTEAVRRAVAIYRFFEESREEGQTIQLVGPDNTVTQVRLMLT